MTKKIFKKLPGVLSIEELAEAMQITNEAANSFIRVIDIPRITLKNNQVKINKSELVDWVL